MARFASFSEPVRSESDIKLTAEPIATFILLQRELADNVDCLLVFVEHPEVEPTNNRSERNVRREAEIRKGARTSKTARGAIALLLEAKKASESMPENCLPEDSSERKSILLRYGGLIQEGLAQNLPSSEEKPKKKKRGRPKRTRSRGLDVEQ